MIDRTVRLSLTYYLHLSDSPIYQIADLPDCSVDSQIVLRIFAGIVAAPRERAGPFQTPPLEETPANFFFFAFYMSVDCT